MDKRKFNKGKIGNKGGGRPTEKEEIEHLNRWRGYKVVTNAEALRLQAHVLENIDEYTVKIDYRPDITQIANDVKKTGKCSGWEAFLLEAVGKRNPSLLGKWADKVLADRHEISTDLGSTTNDSIDNPEADKIRTQYEEALRKLILK